MGWRWTSLARVADPWFDAEQDASARGAVARHLATFAEEGDWITGDDVPGESPLIRSYVVEEAGVRLIWLRVEQFHILELLKIEPFGAGPIG